MPGNFLVLAIVGVLVIQSPSTASAQSTAYCAAGQSPRFDSVVPAVMADFVRT